jgi:hypothetical protein
MEENKMRFDFDEDLMLGAEAAVSLALRSPGQIDALEELAARLTEPDADADQPWVADEAEEDEDQVLELAESIRRSLDLPFYE